MPSERSKRTNVAARGSKRKGRDGVATNAGPAKRPKRPSSPKRQADSGAYVPEPKYGPHVFEDVESPRVWRLLRDMEHGSRVDTCLTDIMEFVLLQREGNRNALHLWHLALVEPPTGDSILAWSGPCRAQGVMDDVAARFGVKLCPHSNNLGSLPGGRDCALPRALAAAKDAGADLSICSFAEQHYTVRKARPARVYISHSTSCAACTRELPRYILGRAAEASQGRSLRSGPKSSQRAAEQRGW